MVKYDLAMKVKEKVPMGYGEAQNAVQAILATMSECLHEGEGININKFGFFKIQHKNQRIGRNPKTKKKVIIKARTVVKFRPSDHWIADLNNT